MTLNALEKQTFASNDELAAYVAENPSLERLVIDNSPAVTSLPVLPQKLRHFALLRCPGINALPALPVSLKYLYVVRVPLIELRSLPAGIKHIDLSGLERLQSVAGWPNKLVELCISSCPVLGLLPAVPAGLRSLIVMECPALKALPNLPRNMEMLWLANNEKLGHICSWPVGLRILEISGGPFNRLPNFPPRLERIVLRRLSNLRFLPQFPPALVELELDELPFLACPPPVPGK